MRRKYLFLSVLAVVSMVSCSEKIGDDTMTDPGVDCDPIPVTITASIASDDPETKLTYTPEGNILKCSWNKGDKVSLIALNSSSEIVSNDVFTAETAGTAVNFKGTYTNNASAASVMIIYPAFISGSGTEADPYVTQKGLSNSYKLNGLFYIKDNKLYIDSDYKINQRYNNDPMNLSDYTLMSSTLYLPDVKKGNVSTTVSHQTYIVKATLNFPSVNKYGSYDYPVYRVQIDGLATGYDYAYAANGFVRFSGGAGGTPKWNLSMYLGNITNSNQAVGYTVSRGSSLTVYMVGYVSQTGYPFEQTAGKNIVISAYDIDYPDDPNKATITLTKNMTFYTGRIYRLSADLSR